MKHIIMLLLASLSITAQAEPRSEAFGADMPATPNAVSLTSAIASLEPGASVETKIEGKITEVCAKKGCWMVLTDGASYARVKFKDYDFFVPKDSSGSDAIVMGSLTAKQLSADEANHYEEDAGRKGKHHDDQREFSIVASSVVIHR